MTRNLNIGKNATRRAAAITCAFGATTLCCTFNLNMPCPRCFLLLCPLNPPPSSPPPPPPEPMEKGSFSLNRHNGAPPSRLGPLNPMQFEWSINTPSAGDGQKTVSTVFEYISIYTHF